MPRLTLLLLALATLTAPAAAQDGRTKARLLFSFETAGETGRLLKGSENSTLSVSQDNGVTHGKNCARWVVKHGADFGVLELDAAARKDWRDFDYLAIDVYLETKQPERLVLELWDKLSKNYATRCTFEEVKLRPGRQTLLYPIGRSRRNGKEGREWDELQPQDKIDLGNLTRVKFFLTPPKDQDAVLWIDNVRLLQEDAAKPKIKLPLPKGALAIKFGSAGEKLPGFRTVAPSASYQDKKEGFDSQRGLSHGGLGWPDALTGTFVTGDEGRSFEFRAHVPKGAYRALLFAGPVFRPKANNRVLLLRLNDRAVIDAIPSADEYYSEKYLYRFLKTTFSARPNALWEDYVARMYPAHDLSIKAEDGLIKLTAQNHFISALILVPATQPQKEWDAFVAQTRALRIKAFNDLARPEAHVQPAKTKDDGDFVLFVPEFGRRLLPSSGPSAAERKCTSLSAAGVPGQLVTLRVAVTPFADLGVCKFETSELVGPATIPAKAITSYVKNWRFDGESLSEMALLPTNSAALEKGITREWYFTLAVPRNSKPGTCKATWSFKPAEGKAVSVPVEVEVYPFALEEILPLSLGMYYSPRHEPMRGIDANERLLKQQVRFMRRLGMTAVPIDAPRVTGLRGGNKVAMAFDSIMIDLALEVGMGRHPAQYQMGGTLGVGRAIGRRLPGSLGAKVDQSPGIELRQPGFADYFRDALKQQRAFYEKTKLPIAVEVVDEPREVPNPWNRNLADTISYAKMVKEAGLVGFVTPMSDSNGGKDYVALVDHVDVVSIHAWKASEKLLKATLKKKKTLWLYNTGMDRYSWGFYAWRVGAAGRWEWHFCFAEDQAKNGYPGREWYNPFTSSHGLAPYAPAEYPGGMLFASSFLDAAEGITDYAYLYTLERLIEKRAKSDRHAKAVKEARDYLRALKGAMPELPGVKGLANADDGALVGLGVEDEARLQAQKWRSKIAALIQALS